MDVQQRVATAPAQYFCCFPISTAQPLLPDRARPRGLSWLEFRVGPRGHARSGRRRRVGQRKPIRSSQL